MSTGLHAFGLGIAETNNQNNIIDVFFPDPMVDLGADAASALNGVSGIVNSAELADIAENARQAGLDGVSALASRLSDSDKSIVAVNLQDNEAPGSVAEAYLKLHLLSHRRVRPHGTNLDGIFQLLPNVAWTSEGAVDLHELPERQLTARLQGRIIEVASVDKFPKMTNYVVPNGVRIAHTARVRLGAYLGEGTTVMHEGFINFNAGAEGPSMVEGRISAGVMVGAGSDLGGGCSTMGTLSGGGNIIISVGSECLIGANAGLGIPLGDRCTIEAGLFVTAGTKVTILDGARRPVETVSARDLSGRSDLLFRRNSTSGAVECLTNKSSIELNNMLHDNN
ncbi:MAG: 2,3,4,5-tetrahydropyridine-2,6-dicarboxylate N-succinyltransferase [Halieaceae bacterium MED-G27]|jgi:2,3,4,5-tetrahydropyridine-2-carboxylate N-succinyltransferase|nr:2,3,4,5-tetrahydropyridine-2,6-dicarboxylate N-succinyltransferase [Halieaceae bacterium]OUT64220.1 MAG: 2,3,4,5-tetrahydropyridine-2,6-dicarboxylate N-succinyltransferase [Cellvibrionales bacterium TMED21]PDH38063.1 MAG: 2,3,4,5-tetrahydropyridine-2,6-dicarboxylate N-succinyltransferase [Halieaceae bacterium MED-G27]|tara:strand:+ start:18262 stop:19275 length:1014 start_codon:yes stop_codon:yes gene_type:complete